MVQDRLAQALAMLLDDNACRDVISRYSAAIDWADREALTTVFWPDARIDFGAAFFIGGAADGIEFLLGAVKASITRTHSLGTIWLKLGKNSARAETPAVNIWLGRNPDGSLTRYSFTARYLWDLQKRQGEWRVASLAGIINSAQCTPYDPASQPPGLELREGLDPAHGLFPGLHV